MIIELSDDNLNATAQLMVDAAKSGSLILFPTDTVYGLGGVAFSRKVFEKLRQVKPEREAKPTAVLISSILRMSQVGGDVPNQKIVNLAQRYWPGPLTLVWKSSAVVPAEFQTEDLSLGYRVPNFPFLLRVLEELELPLWATSANLPGQPAPRIFSEISEQVIKACDLVIKTAKLLQGKASTVVDVRKNAPVILREGAIREAEILQIWK